VLGESYETSQQRPGERRWKGGVGGRSGKKEGEVTVHACPTNRGNATNTTTGKGEEFRGAKGRPSLAIWETGETEIKRDPA